MADIDVGVNALGGSARATVKAVPPLGWFGVVALLVLGVLAWHLWDREEEDTSSWHDPQQPPENVEPLRVSVPTNTQMQPSWDTNAMRGRRGGAIAPGAY